MNPSTPATLSPETPAEPISEAAKQSAAAIREGCQKPLRFSTPERDWIVIEIQRAITAARGQDAQRIAELTKERDTHASELALIRGYCVKVCNTQKTAEEHVRTIDMLENIKSHLRIFDGGPAYYANTLTCELIARLAARHAAGTTEPRDRPHGGEPTT